jgi:hypothetical protein
MGEYAMFGKEEIKIGTCESMYYLRADQAHKVRPLSGNVDPIRNRLDIRFRFPFPDEDRNAPGHFDPYMRGIFFHVPVPEGVEHGNKQFQGEGGYLVSLPCPESKACEDFSKREGLRFFRNGHQGPCSLVQQKWVKQGNREFLVPVFRCTGCDSLWRIETIEECAPYIASLRTQANERKTEGNLSAANFFDSIADRIEAGFNGRLPEGV